MTTSPFTAGTKLAKFSTTSFGGPRMSWATVAKVRKDGRFTIQYAGGTVGEQQWKPLHTAQGWEARRTGKGNHYREWLEVWGPEHDARIEREQQRISMENVKAEVLKRIGELSTRSEQDSAKLAAILGLLNRQEG